MVIETTNRSSTFQKDFTDFIVLDHIYQHAVSDRDVDCFIIFTGDGHFSSVVNFIRQKCEREVGIYGVRFAMSGILKSAASWCVELPEEEKKVDPDMPYMDLVLSYLKDRENQKEVEGMSLPAMVAYIKSHSQAEEARLKAAAEKLIKLGYLKRVEKIAQGNRLVSALEANWIKLKKDDFWDDQLYMDEK